MYKRLLGLLFAVLLYAGNGIAKTSAYVDVAGDFSYCDSKGLNRLTDGFNSGYGTSFSPIHVPLGINMEIGVRTENMEYGFVFGFNYASRSSLSSIYSYTQDIRLGLMPLGISVKYFWYSASRFFVSSGLSATAYRASLSTYSSPNPLKEGDIGMRAWGGAATAFINLDYEVTRKTFLTSSLGFRYSRTANLKYTTNNGGHNEGDYVLFNDGTNLTLNLSGLNFLVGLKFYFGEI
jgi:hypothetical protein